MPDKKTLFGIALGVAGTLAAPFVVSAVGSAARPFAKGVLKYSLLASEKLRERCLLLLEDIADLMAEVRIEVQDELARKGPSQRAHARRATVEPDANGVVEAAQSEVHS
ncbi:MAG TPA: hypothetical protein VM580_08400 [Labilithrix sp.]|nr:hypothetical protein [Labilithrix sp.]